MNFIEKIKKISQKNRSFLCVGLDSDIKKIPLNQSQFQFNKFLIDQTYDYVCSYKLNTAFYEAIGYKGIKGLKRTCDYLKAQYPEIPIIIDAKRGDVGHTNYGYAEFIFDYLKADAVTVNPYLGEEALLPFLERKDKGIIILCKTSNPKAAEFQDLEVAINKKKLKLYQYVAYQVAKKWNKNKNCLLVVGATYPKELKEVRALVGEEIWFLIPGVGAQGGKISQVLRNGLNKNKEGLIINVSRSVIFSNNPREAAFKLKEEIQRKREIYSR